MSRRRIRQTARIYPRIAPHLAQRLAQHAAASGISETSIVEEALKRYLDQAGDMALLMARIDRHGRALERCQRDMQLHAEGFATFVKMWLAQTPPLPPETRKATLEGVPARFAQFLQYVAREISRGAGFFDLLPREQLGDDERLVEVQPGSQSTSRARTMSGEHESLGPTK